MKRMGNIVETLRISDGGGETARLGRGICYLCSGQFNQSSITVCFSFYP